jgi:mRNA interferase MazF
VAEELSWGDIRMVTLDKVRPAVVLTRSVVIRHLNTVTVAPITSTVRGIPTEVPVGVENGLKAPSAVALDHLVTVSKSRIGRWLGALGHERKREVREALLFALELDDASLTSLP